MRNSEQRLVLCQVLFSRHCIGCYAENRLKGTWMQAPRATLDNWTEDDVDNNLDQGDSKVTVCVQIRVHIHVCADVYVFVCACRGQRLVSCVFLSHFPS